MSFYVGFRHFILECGSPEVVIPFLIWYVTAIRSCDVYILWCMLCQRDSTSYLSTYWHRATTNDLSDCGEQR